MEVYPKTTAMIEAGDRVATAYFFGGYQSGNIQATTTVNGINGKTVKFLSGSVAGGVGSISISLGGYSNWADMTGSSAIGWIDVKDSAGNVIATIGLPLLSPVVIDEVYSFDVNVVVVVNQKSDSTVVWDYISATGCASVVYKVL